MSDLTKRLCRPGYDLQKEQAIQEAIIEIRKLRAKIEAMEQQKPVGMLHAGSYYGEELEDWEFEANQGACDKLGAPKSCPNDDARCNRLLAATPEVEGK